MHLFIHLSIYLFMIMYVFSIHLCITSYTMFNLTRLKMTTQFCSTPRSKWHPKSKRLWNLIILLCVGCIYGKAHETPTAMINQGFIWKRPDLITASVKLRTQDRDWTLNQCGQGTIWNHQNRDSQWAMSRSLKHQVQSWPFHLAK